MGWGKVRKGKRYDIMSGYHNNYHWNWNCMYVCMQMGKSNTIIYGGSLAIIPVFIFSSSSSLSYGRWWSSDWERENTALIVVVQVSYRTECHFHP